MKSKIILLCMIFFISFVNANVYATDACDRLVPQYASFMWKATMASNLRSYPCVYKSTVHGASKVWEVYEVLSKVDGWYQIKYTDGNIYRIWDQALSKTSQSIPETTTEEPVVEPEDTWYSLTLKDRLIINKFLWNITPVINRKWLDYRDLIVLKIAQFIDTGKYPERLNVILQEIIDILLEIWEEEEAISSVSASQGESSYSLANIDYDRVKYTWLWRYNDVRSDMWLSKYQYNSKLEQTAVDWSNTSKQRWEITHKRNTWDSYYDYDKITSWFKERWVVCKNIYRVTHTENIWWGTYSCNDWDCTDELIDGIRSTFDYYMSEKGKSYDAHYQSIVNKYFTMMWLWITLEDRGSGRYKYYLTTHYCTELID